MKGREQYYLLDDVGLPPVKRTPKEIKEDTIATTEFFRALRAKEAKKAKRKK